MSSNEELLSSLLPLTEEEQVYKHFYDLRGKNGGLCPYSPSSDL